MNEKDFWRYTVLGVIFVFAGVFLVFRMFSLQVNDYVDVFHEQEENYLVSQKIIYPERGKIVDRWGHLLAGNQKVYEVKINLHEVENPETLALVLSGVLGRNFDEIYEIANQKTKEGDSGIIIVDNYVTPEMINQIEEIREELEVSPQKGSNGITHSLKGLEYNALLFRSYPEKDLASNILGFVNYEYKGYFGIEGYYNQILGHEGPEWFEEPTDPRQVVNMPELPKGASLVLTIDREIQASTESILDAAIKSSGANAGTIVVMDPRTGEILAMASSPRIDVNNFSEELGSFDKEKKFNMAIHSYEPGSVFKIFTMAAGLDSGAVEPDTSFIDNGFFEYGGVTIYNWDRGAWGPQDMTGCLQHSLNVCLAWVASELGEGRFYDYMQRFGFGHITGIGLAGEEAGRLKRMTDDDWYSADLATNAFGQGVLVTPIQMLMAASAIANDGQMVVPWIIYAVSDGESQYVSSPQYAGNPISAETAHTLSLMLTKSLEKEASSALVPGYKVAGKTGTAEISIPGKGYVSNLTNASFLGWGPTDDPQFMVYVWLQKPTSSPWGSVVAAPVFSQVARRLVVMLNIPPDDVHLQIGQMEEKPSSATGN
ncbi:MAG TPA: penicillin-binding protein 2 [Anaerolineae bacterium]|nr:penicillin-binding protein 2 [Anaerolineae bacterium]